jgi:hypothetical protein
MNTQLFGHTIENITSTVLINEITDIIHLLNTTKEKKKKLCEKLKGYRYIDEIYQLDKGRYVRWINKKTNEISHGGTILDIKIMENGVNILIKTIPFGKLQQYRFDDCFTFQKITPEELLVIMGIESISE